MEYVVCGADYFSFGNAIYPYAPVVKRQGMQEVKKKKGRAFFSKRVSCKDLLYCSQHFFFFYFLLPLSVFLISIFLPLYVFNLFLKAHYGDVPAAAAVTLS